jgi:hypothetical protein
LANTPVEAGIRKLQVHEILLPDLAAAVGAGHFGQGRRALQADDTVPALRKVAQVAPRSAAEIQDREGCRSGYVAQQRIDVLQHVMIPRALPEGFGTSLVMLEGTGDDALKNGRIECHVWPMIGSRSLPACPMLHQSELL